MIIDLYAQHNIVVFLDFNKYVPYFTDYGTLQLFLEFGLPNKQIEVFLHNLNTDYLESLPKTNILYFESVCNLS